MQHQADDQRLDFLVRMRAIASDNNHRLYFRCMMYAKVQDAVTRGAGKYHCSFSMGKLRTRKSAGRDPPVGLAH